MPRTLRAPRNRYGQALVEYALTVALIGVGLVAILVTLRNSVGNSFNSTSNRVDEVGSCGYAATGGCAAGELAGGGGDDGAAGAGDGNNGNGNGGGNGGGNGNGNNGNGGGNGSNGGGNGSGNGNGNNGNGNGNGGAVRMGPPALRSTDRPA